MKETDQIASEAAAEWYDPKKQSGLYEQLKQDFKSAIEKATEGLRDANNNLFRIKQRAVIENKRLRAAHASEQDLGQVQSSIHDEKGVCVGFKSQPPHASEQGAELTTLARLAFNYVDAVNIGMGYMSAERELRAACEAALSQRPTPATDDTKRRLIELMKHLAFSNHGFKPESCSECFNCNSVLSQTKEKE